MSVSEDRWTCPDCAVTEHLEGPRVLLDQQRASAQDGHAARHLAERAKAVSIAEALADAIDQIVEFRVRLVVAPGDVERVRSMVVRREMPVEVLAGDLAPGLGYVMVPRRGVRAR